MLRKRLNDLYKDLFNAKTLEEREEIQNEIDKLLINTNNLTPYSHFMSRMYKKEFAKVINKFKLGDDVSDIVLAKAMSSSITHSLIDMDCVGSNQYNNLYIPEQADLLSRFLLGEVSKEEVRKFYRDLK